MTAVGMASLGPRTVRRPHPTMVITLTASVRRCARHLLRCRIACCTRQRPPRGRTILAQVDRSRLCCGVEPLWLAGIERQGDHATVGQTGARRLPGLAGVVRAVQAAITGSVDPFRLLRIDQHTARPSLGRQTAHLAPASETVHAEIWPIWRGSVEPASVHAALKRGVCERDNRALRPRVHFLPASAAVLGTKDALPIDPGVECIGAEGMDGECRHVLAWESSAHRLPGLAAIIGSYNPSPWASCVDARGCSDSGGDGAKHIRLQGCWDGQRLPGLPPIGAAEETACRFEQAPIRGI